MMNIIVLLSLLFFIFHFRIHYHIDWLKPPHKYNTIFCVRTQFFVWNLNMLMRKSHYFRAYAHW